MEEEKEFLKHKDVFVSNARVIIGGTTYATANITSVTKRITPAKTGCAGFLIFLGVIGIIVGFIVLNSDDANNGWPHIALALVFLGIGVLWYRSMKPTYHIVFASSSGQIDALTSKDGIFINKVVSAINQAIIYRG